MAIDLSKLSDKALAKLQDDIGLEFKSREKSKREQARKDAEAAARKHGFSLSELVDGKKAAKRPPVPAKYRNPADASQTWSGRGRQPEWYKAAISSGTDPKKLEI